MKLLTWAMLLTVGMLAIGQTSSLQLYRGGRLHDVQTVLVTPSEASEDTYNGALDGTSASAADAPVTAARKAAIRVQTPPLIPHRRKRALEAIRVTSIESPHMLWTGFEGDPLEPWGLEPLARPSYPQSPLRPSTTEMVVSGRGLVKRSGWTKFLRKLANFFYKIVTAFLMFFASTIFGIKSTQWLSAIIEVFVTLIFLPLIVITSIYAPPIGFLLFGLVAGFAAIVANNALAARQQMNEGKFTTWDAFEKEWPSRIKQDMMLGAFAFLGSVAVPGAGKFLVSGMRMVATSVIGTAIGTAVKAGLNVAAKGIRMVVTKAATLAGKKGVGMVAGKVGSIGAGKAAGEVATLGAGQSVGKINPVFEGVMKNAGPAGKVGTSKVTSFLDLAAKKYAATKVGMGTLAKSAATGVGRKEAARLATAQVNKKLLQRAAEKAALADATKVMAETVEKKVVKEASTTWGAIKNAISKWHGRESPQAAMDAKNAANAALRAGVRRGVNDADRLELAIAVKQAEKRLEKVVSHSYFTVTRKEIYMSILIGMVTALLLGSAIMSPLEEQAMKKINVTSMDMWFVQSRMVYEVHPPNSTETQWWAGFIPGINPGTSSYDAIDILDAFSQANHTAPTPNSTRLDDFNPPKRFSQLADGVYSGPIGDGNVTANLLDMTVMFNNNLKTVSVINAYATTMDYGLVLDPDSPYERFALMGWTRMMDDGFYVKYDVLTDKLRTFDAVDRLQKESFTDRYGALLPGKQFPDPPSSALVEAYAKYTNMNSVAYNKDNMPIVDWAVISKDASAIAKDGGAFGTATSSASGSTPSPTSGGVTTAAPTSPPSPTSPP